jgi:hypothetical protein
LTFPTTQFPKLIFLNVPPNAFNTSSIHDSGTINCLSASRIDREQRGGEEGRRTSVRMRERRELEFGEGVDMWGRRDSMDRWRRFGRRGSGEVRGREDSYEYGVGEREYII